jgi:hypothetical protein
MVGPVENFFLNILHASGNLTSAGTHHALHRQSCGNMHGLHALNHGTVQREPFGSRRPSL